ncbi:uncharacterized protein [Coffea arabica]|uniref:Uncharacterized protein isoform X1 n=1 Tax=Coffea arabica TaxID=13443 RepID=A0A6P6TG31_COFAR
MVPPISHTPAKLNSQDMKDDGQAKKMLLSEYEQSREERIKQNLERMQKLGIFDLSLKLKSLKPAPPNPNPSCTRRNLRHFSPLPPPGPIRRSSRLRNGTPVSYSEVHLTNEDKPFENGLDLLREEGSRPEVYTEEHEKLLGSTEMSWTLFVDGFGKDGKRIYDPVNGKTCHQCRQKTLGHRTHCSNCNKVQGQFCGDCLYMRYGEHVLEANQNPNWICPVCRAICNCSLCRQSKGWPPTGSLYRKISSLGFKSVAHYLVQTRRNLATNSGLECPQSEGKMTDDCLDDGKQEESTDSLNNKNHGHTNELPDSIAGRLRQRRKAVKEHEEAMSTGKKNGTADIKQKLNNKNSPPSKAEATVNHSNSTAPDVTPVAVTDSIAGRLRQRRNQGNQYEEQRSAGAKDGIPDFKAEASLNHTNSATPPDVAPITRSNSNKRRVSEPSPDSIAGRLRQRRAEV